MTREDKHRVHNGTMKKTASTNHAAAPAATDYQDVRNCQRREAVGK